MSETKSRGGRKALEPGELGSYTITGYRADGTATTKSASYYSARAWVGLEYGGRKRVQVRGASRTEVRRLMSERAEALAEEDSEQGAAAQSSIPATWRAAVQNHRAYITGPLANKGRGYSEASKRVYLSAIDSYLLGERCPFAGDRRLSTIKRGHLEDWLAGIANTEEENGNRRIGGEGAAKTVRSVVQGIYSRAERAEVVKVNPAKRLEFERKPELKAGEKGIRDHGRPFTMEEVRHLLEIAYSDRRCVANDMGDLVQFLLATGCRIGEVRALTWPHVHFEGRGITVVGAVRSGAGRAASDKLASEFVTIAHTDNPRAKTQQAHLVRPKTDNSHRDVKLDLRTVAMLKTRRERMGLVGHESPLILGEVAAVFPNSRGKVRDQKGLDEQFAHLFKVAEVPWAGTHTFRKTVVNRLHDNGTPARFIAAHIGDTIETVMRHYLEASEAAEDMGQAVAAAVFGTDPAEKVDTEVDTKGVAPVLSVVKAG